MARRRAQQRENVRYAAARQALLDLAQHASGYLRQHSMASVRLATALLLAASVAACNASASDQTMVQTRAVAPLTQEIVSGLPRGPGAYPVVPGSVFRDQRGVYQFEWLDPSASSATAASAASPGQASGGNVAYSSRLRLLRDDRLLLEVPETGQGDPVLHLPETENVGLIQEAQVGAAQAGPAYYPPVYSYWHPFSPGMVILGRPAYYDPPRTIIVEQAPNGPSSSGSGGRTTLPVEGGSVSETARPPAARVTGVQSAVSGRAGGTGAGNAVTSRNAASGAAQSAGRSASGSSGGTSGAAGASSGSAGIARSSGGSSSGGSVSAPRSGGFSSGGGSSGGSAAS